MYLLFVTVSLINLALGYALAVHLGWGKWPDIRDAAAPQPTDHHTESSAPAESEKHAAAAHAHHH